MLLALAATAIVALVLAWDLSAAQIKGRLRRTMQRVRQASFQERPGYDRGRELRAEARARALLRSCINAEEWEIYCDLGFLTFTGGAGAGQREQPNIDYLYVIYPHKPIVAVLSGSLQVVGEYCVTFPRTQQRTGPQRLPDSDDVLAKWMLLSADERGLLAQANVHLPGRQVDPALVQADLRRLARWRAAAVGHVTQVGRRAVVRDATVAAQ